MLKLCLLFNRNNSLEEDLSSNNSFISLSTSQKIVHSDNGIVLVVVEKDELNMLFVLQIFNQKQEMERVVSRWTVRLTGNKR